MDSQGNAVLFLPKRPPHLKRTIKGDPLMRDGLGASGESTSASSTSSPTPSRLVCGGLVMLDHINKPVKDHHRYTR